MPEGSRVEKMSSAENSRNSKTVKFSVEFSDTAFRPTEGEYKGLILYPCWRNFDPSDQRTKVGTDDGRYVDVDELKGTDVELLSDVDIDYDGLSDEEKKEIEPGKIVLETLANAFGGYSQLPDHVIGMAIAGQLNNGGAITTESAPQVIQYIVDLICDRYNDLDSDSGAAKIREEIIRGMKEEANDWKDDPNNRAWSVINALEKK